MNQQDMLYMQAAIELAQQGGGYVHPNPKVGAIVVKDGRIIGRGYHQRYGELHAERNALADCSENPEGGTIYVTLEPCCHYGKTPPCTEAIIENKLARVVIGSRDPNPLVSGKGAEILRNAGITVEQDFLREDCDKLNPIFFHYIRKGTPYVTMKFAMTLEGKIATRTGASQWISGEASRRHTHVARAEHMGIMVGVETVLADNPSLTAREGGLSPIRIVCDSKLRTPLDATVITTAVEQDDSLRQPRTILATCSQDEEAKDQYRKQGVTVLTLSPDAKGHVDMEELMLRLGDMKIDSILCEGGGTLNWSMLQAGLVHHVQAYIAPKLFGGTAKSPIAGLGVATPDEAFQLKNTTIMKIGEDYLLEGEVNACSQES